MLSHGGLPYCIFFVNENIAYLFRFNVPEKRVYLKFHFPLMPLWKEQPLKYKGIQLYCNNSMSISPFTGSTLVENIYPHYTVHVHL